MLLKGLRECLFKIDYLEIAITLASNYSLEREVFDLILFLYTYMVLTDRWR